MQTPSFVRAPARRAPCLLLCALLLACHTNDIVGTDSAADLASPGGPGPGGGGAPDLGAGGGDYCRGSGPPVLVSPGGGTSGAVCTGRLAQVAFRYGLCTCGAFNAGAAVTVDSYDSQMAMSPRSLSGSVGINGTMATSSTVTIGGSLWIGDAGGLAFNTVRVGQELRSAGSASGTTELTVGGNASINGDANVGGPLSVGGVLTLPAGRTLSGNPAPPRVVRAPVSVAPPCDCSPESRVDIAGYMSYYREHNDNAALFLDPDRLHNFNGDAALALPCGRYYLNQINGTGKLDLVINGRVALFVGGDINFTQDLNVRLGSGGELDLFVGGTLNGGAALNLGAPETASRVRLYVASTGSISLSGAVTLAGNLYAPQASLNVGGPLTVYGALFVRQVATPAVVQLHHDASILRAGQGCPPPPPTCTSCRDCGNQACADGVCGRCTTDSQCCSPLQCRSGQCVYVVE